MGQGQDPPVQLYPLGRNIARTHAVFPLIVSNKDEDRRRTILQRSFHPSGRMLFLDMPRFQRNTFKTFFPIEYRERNMDRTGTVPVNFSLNSRSGLGFLPGPPPPRPRELFAYLRVYARGSPGPASRRERVKLGLSPNVTEGALHRAPVVAAFRLRVAHVCSVSRAFFGASAARFSLVPRAGPPGAKEDPSDRLWNAFEALETLPRPAGEELGWTPPNHVVWGAYKRPHTV